MIRATNLLFTSDRTTELGEPDLDYPDMGKCDLWLGRADGVYFEMPRGAWRVHFRGSARFEEFATDGEAERFLKVLQREFKGWQT